MESTGVEPVSTGTRVSQPFCIPFGSTRKFSISRQGLLSFPYLFGNGFYALLCVYHSANSPFCPSFRAARFRVYSRIYVIAPYSLTKCLDSAEHQSLSRTSTYMIALHSHNPHFRYTTQCINWCISPVKEVETCQRTYLNTFRKRTNFLVSAHFTG